MFCPNCGERLAGALNGVESVCAFCRCVFTTTFVSDELRIQQIIEAFRNAKKIEAIKKMRELTNCGLKVAKCLVEAMMELDGR